MLPAILCANMLDNTCRVHLAGYWWAHSGLLLEGLARVGVGVVYGGGGSMG